MVRKLKQEGRTAQSINTNSVFPPGRGKKKKIELPVLQSSGEEESEIKAAHGHRSSAFAWPFLCRHLLVDCGKYRALFQDFQGGRVIHSLSIYLLSK